MKKKLFSYATKVLIGLDIFICSFWPWSKERETISGLLGSDFDGSIAEYAVNWIFWKMGWWDNPDHCTSVANKEKSFIE
jgi:hypothetical protein